MSTNKDQTNEKVEGNGKVEERVRVEGIVEEKVLETVEVKRKNGEQSQTLTEQQLEPGDFTIKYVTPDNNDGEEFTVLLDPKLTLDKLRADLEGQPDIGQGWVYLREKKRLVKSSESKMTVTALAGTEKTIELQLTKEKSSARSEEVKEQLKELSEKLSAVRLALARPKDGLLSKDDMAALELPAHLKEERGGKWGGDTGKGYRGLKADELAEIVRSLGLPRAARREPDGSFVMTEFTAGLKAPEPPDPAKKRAPGDSDLIDMLVRKYTVAANEVETRVEKFTKVWQKRSFESGFMNISAALQLSFPALGGRLGASGSYERSEQTEESDQKGGSKLYIVGSQEVRKARVFVPFEMVKLYKRVQTRLEEATRPPAAPGEAPKNFYSDEQILENLEPLLDEYGYFVATEYVLGAKLTTFDDVDTSDYASAKAKNVEQEIAAALSYKRPLGGGLDASGGIGTGSSSKSSDKSTDERLAFRLQAKGGSATDRYDPQAWIKSIQPDNWEVIAYGRLIPIYEFIEDKEVRERCKKAQKQLADRHFYEAVQRWATNSSRTSDTEDASEQGPKSEGKANKKLQVHQLKAYTNWVEVPKAQYFRGARLMPKDGYLTLSLIVVDKNMSPLLEVESDTKKSNKAELPDVDGTGQKKADDAAHFDEMFVDDKDYYFDTSPVPIPPGHRITAMRLRRLDSPRNRIGIEVKTVKGVPGEPGSERVRCHYGDNSLYINKKMGEIYLSTVGTVAPDGKCIVGIHLADLNPATNTLGIKLQVRPIGG
jgi:hypothetical protein